MLYICIIKIKQQYNGNTEIQQERDHERRMEIIQTLPKILLVFWQVLSIAWDNAKIEIKNNEAKAKRLAEEEARRIEYRKHVVLSHVGMDSLYGNRVYSGD